MTLPPNDLPTVRKALETALGTARLDACQPLPGGLSGASLFKIRVGGICYLLRLEPERDAVRDPYRGYRCLALASEACLAPRVRYADPDAGVLITDFVEVSGPTDGRPSRREPLAVELGQTLRALHAISGFPLLIDYLDGLAELVGRAARSGVLPKGAFAAWPALYTACRRLEPQLVASHNDLNPGNILDDGRRLWLIDWEAAFRADRYVDLAAVANVYAPDAEGEARLLETYFGRPADRSERARLYLFRQVNHLFHAAIFMVGVAGEARATSLEGPSLEALHQRLATGEAVFATPQGRLDYALARLRTATANIESAAFAEAAGLAA